MIFLIIVATIFILQIILVTFGSTAMGVYEYYGLNIIQWLITMAIGSIGLLIGVIAKMIPENKICLSLGSKEAASIESREPGINLKRKMSSFNRNLSMNRVAK